MAGVEWKETRKWDETTPGLALTYETTFDLRHELDSLSKTKNEAIQRVVIKDALSEEASATDIPESIIMPEVFIPEGARSVNVPVEGGIPGVGKLFVEVPGLKTVVIPVVVR